MLESMDKRTTKISKLDNVRTVFAIVHKMINCLYCAYAKFEINISKVSLRATSIGTREK